MRRWIIVGFFVVALGALWYVLTEPSDDPQPGGLSSHQVVEEQPFNPYLNDASEAESNEGDAEETVRTNGAQGEHGRTEPGVGESEGDPETAEPRTSQEESARGDRRDPPNRSDDGSVEAGTIQNNEALTAAEARELADTYLNGASTDPERNLELYADRVNYYDEGTVSRSEVLQDKKNYLKRWSTRNYERTSDVEVTNAGAADLIRFNYRYRVSGGSRTAEGQGWAELGVQRQNGRVYIVSERGGVIDRE